MKGAFAAGGLLVAAVAWTVWWYWSADDPAPLAEAASSTAPRLLPGGAAGFVEPPIAASVTLPNDDPRSDEATLWAEAERLCPWPPDPQSWQVLGAPCLEAMDAIKMDDDWLLALEDPLGTRYAVAEALDRPECMVPPTLDADGNPSWPGDVRTDLRETCAAAAMVRLAKLQEKCIVPTNTDWHAAYEIEQVVRESFFADRAPDMATYHRMARSLDQGRAWKYWEAYKCASVPPEALAWVVALPDPPSPLSAIQPAILRTFAEVTQRLHLYEAARRLGWDFSDHMVDALRDFAARGIDAEPDL